MKRKDIFKMVGVKDEKSFYDKYPNTPEGEKAFLAKYGKQLKLQGGDMLQPKWTPSPVQPPSNELASLEGHLSGYKMPFDIKGFAGENADLPGKLVKGFKKLKAEKNAMLAAQQWEKVSDVALDASRSRDVDAPRQMADVAQKKREAMMPVNTGEEFFPIYGVGTNVLAKDGTKLRNRVGGNKTEIQNTYDPNTIYSDSGYTPLERADLGSIIAGPIGEQVGGITKQLYGENAGSEIGGDIGGTIGGIFGPVGSVVGKEVGKLAGWALDRRPAKTKKAKEATMQNVGMMGAQNAIQGMQSQFGGYMEEGGWVSHDWTPQLITKFGEHKLSDLLKDDPTMDTLRTGGHIRENSGLPDFAMGGDLKTHWGGYAEPVSQNPYLPDGGETVMFRGQSHDEADGRGRTGIGVTYGNNPVEVERGEPAVKLQDGSTLDSDLVVFGNLKIPNQYITMLGDTNAKGKKFKSYVADLSKVENKQNKLIDKTSNELDDLNVNSSFDKLKMSSYTANIMGANMKLKEIAEKKQNAAALQQAINDTAEERGLEASALAEGKVKMAKLGKTMKKAQEGEELEFINPADYERLVQMYDAAQAQETQGKGKAIEDFQREFARLAPNRAKAALKEVGMGPTNYAKTQRPELEAYDPLGNIDQYWGPRTKAYRAAMESARIVPTVDTTTIKETTPTLSMSTEDLDLRNKPLKKFESTPDPERRSKLLDMIGDVLPYFRPSDTESLDARQLAGEMFALSQNRLEPVQMQTFQPQLTVPYDISLQDILNENVAAGRAAQRMAGYNPAAQANIAAQQYAANQKVLGEQFRMNQAQKNQVYAQNRQLLDQAKLQNLGEFDKQYVRQEEAKANTKATTQAALNSISDKFMKNQLSNRTLQTYENLYGYRFGPDMIAQNWNAPAKFDFSGRNASASIPEGFEAVYKKNDEGDYEVESYKKKKKESRNGSIVSALRKL